MNTGLGSSNSIVGTILAVIAIVLSAIALYFAADARSLRGDLKTATAALDDRVAQVSSQTEALNNQLSSLELTTRQKFEAVGTKLLAMETRTAPRTNQPPSRAAQPQPAGPTTELVYKVKAGDLLSKIAKRNNTTVEAIKKANPGLDDRHLKVDQKIKIPVAAPQPKPVVQPPPVE